MANHSTSTDIDTQLVTLGRDAKRDCGSVNPPVHRTSTVLFQDYNTFANYEAGKLNMRSYGRYGTPTSDGLEEALVALEGADHAISTGSGLAAITTTMLAFLSAGDHLLVPDSLYSSARKFVEHELVRYGIAVEFYDPTIGAGIEALIKSNTRMVYCESPGSLTFEMQDIPAISRVAKAKNKNILIVADNTWATPLLQKPFAMGVDIFGNAVVEDLAEMPHLLVAGSTGAGKSVFMNTLIGSLIARHSAATLRLVMIDPKMVEMAAYNDLPHMACKVITDPAGEARLALGRLVSEMDERYRRMQAVGARNIDSFNEIIRTQKITDFLSYEGKWSIMPYIVLIIDEMADMMMLLGKEIETPITRLAQKARACGIHMVIATQRPSADVVTGLIKANFPTRVAFRVMSGIDSRTILDQNGAETLLGKGDMIYLSAGKARRLHGAYLAESEVQSMVKAAKAKKK